MTTREKKSYQFESDLYLMSPSWEAWSTWDTTTSVRQKQMYFDSKIGNIYKDWHLHHDELGRMRDPRMVASPWFKLNDPYMLVGVKITRTHYNLSLLNYRENRVLTLKHRRDCMWYAKVWLKV